MSSQPSSSTSESFDIDANFLVACLCASWCATCRDYRGAFLALDQVFPDAAFVWLDVEEDAKVIGHLDIENFPTLLVQRDDVVLFFGVMLPNHNQLKQLIQAFKGQSADELANYALSSPERRSWQNDCNLRQRLRSIHRSADVGC